MKTSTKVWLVAAAVLVLAGCILFAGVMAVLGWDFGGLSTVDYESNTHEVKEFFDGISIRTDTADIVFAPSGDGKCTVVCYEEEGANHTVSVKNRILVVEPEDNRNVSDWVSHVGINAGSPKITVYLPRTEYTDLLIDAQTGGVEVPGDFRFRGVDISVRTGIVDLGASASGTVRIKTTTGSVRAVNLSAGELDLSVSTGRVTATGVACTGDVAVHATTGKVFLTDISCGSLTSTGSTGDISLERVIAGAGISLRRTTGDIRFDGTDAAEIDAETTTGDVTGTLLTQKVFTAHTTTGKVDVPQSATGGQCRITSSTGDIRIQVK